jgi:lysozyme family protein
MARANSLFWTSLQKTLTWEGGYVFDPDDPGGETKFGISRRSFPEVDIKALTIEQAADYYRRHYWDCLLLDEFKDPALAGKLFDLAVNCGCKRAALLVQEAVSILRTAAGLPGIAIDGKIGPQTLWAVNAVKHPQALVSAVKILAGNHYIQLAQVGSGRFLDGWLRRLEG